GVYLKDKGLGKFDYYYAEVPGGNHAWLQKGSIVVDITADQFPHINNSVIVSKNSEWHQSLISENKGEFDFRDDIDSAIDDENAYKIILQTIEQST
ncbi:hypothetical protein, partial [Vibrio parahaemolyticus]